MLLNYNPLHMLRLTFQDLTKLLNHTHHIFWTHVLHNQTLQQFLDQFLASFARNYTYLQKQTKNINTKNTNNKTQDNPGSNPSPSEIIEMNELFNKISQYVLLVFVRICTLQESNGKLKDFARALRGALLFLFAT